MSDRHTGDSSSVDGHRSVLRPDCEKCVGLCCVAPAFSAAADFAIDKPAGRPCPNLRADFRCGIHANLRDLGFPGCAAYDCFGAGQRVTQETFGGADWRADPDIAPRMFAAFSIVRQLHELLWYLTEALALPATRPLHPELQASRDETEGLAGGDVGALGALDVAGHGRRVNALLRSASALARAASRRHTAGLWTLIAWIHWRGNDRQAAWPALHLALDIDPDQDPPHYLAVFMYDHVDPHCIPPVRFR